MSDQPTPIRGTDHGGGITLLEAYSALSSQKSRTAAVEVPFPGQSKSTDPEGSFFWTFRIRNTG